MVQQTQSAKLTQIQGLLNTPILKLTLTNKPTLKSVSELLRAKSPDSIFKPFLGGLS
jgi:hypothetical protein